MRTNIHLDDDLIEQARQYSMSASKRALVREALQTYVAVKEEEKRRATYSERLQKLREKIKEVPQESDSRDILRSDRDSR
jgi:Arc/MetJ family transcription regulator